MCPKAKGSRKIPPKESPREKFEYRNPCLRAVHFGRQAKQYRNQNVQMSKNLSLGFWIWMIRICPASGFRLAAGFWKAEFRISFFGFIKDSIQELINLLGGP